MNLQHCYSVLGVDASASPAELKRAHRDLVQVWHPDRFMANPRLRKLAQEKLLEINQAYDALRCHEPTPPAEAARPAPAAPRPALRRWLYPGVQAAGVAAVVLALIMASRAFYALLDFKQPAAPIATMRQEPDEAQPPRASLRRGRAAYTETLVANGEEIMEPRGRAGVGRLTVSNQTDHDAVATLLDQANGSTLRMVYVVSGMQVEIGGIGPGVYRLSLSSGAQWSRSALGFTRDQTPPRSVGPFTFTQVQTAGQVRGDQYGIVLRHDIKSGSEMSQAGM